MAYMIRIVDWSSDVCSSDLRPTDFIAPLNLHLYSSVRCPPAKSNCLRLCHALYAFGPQKTLRGRGKPVFRPSHSHSSRGKRRIYAGAANRTATDSRAGAARHRRHRVTTAGTRPAGGSSDLRRYGGRLTGLHRSLLAADRK